MNCVLTALCGITKRTANYVLSVAGHDGSDPAPNGVLYSKDNVSFSYNEVVRILATINGPYSSYILMTSDDMFKKLFELGDCFVYDFENSHAYAIDSSLMVHDAKLAMPVHVSNYSFQLSMTVMILTRRPLDVSLEDVRKAGNPVV